MHCCPERRPAKNTIVEFVAKLTKQGALDFAPPAEPMPVGGPVE
jgi:hypothetical protein